MARYINRIQVPFEPQSLLQPMGDYLTREGFSQTTYKGQIVWKKGIGMLTAPQYVAFSFGEDYVQLEAFIKFALFPGVYIGEMGIKGVFGAIPKNLLKTRVTAIELFLSTLIQQPPVASEPVQ